jgi:RNA polymerase sigma factor (sigma-70 family)
MDEPDDIELLRRFVEQHSEADFAVLVRRQIDLVYSAALRQTRNPHAAEEVTQAVFVVLARKAGSLLLLGTLTGWLYQATRLTAANYLRAESRRARRDQEAYMQSLINETAEFPEEAWTQTAPLLESAMGELSPADRDAVLLRYFQNKSLRDVGLELGINEDAARMRLNRALERLRRFLTRRDVSLSAAALATVLAANSVQAAPATLAASVAATVARGAIAGSSVAVLAKGTLSILAWARYKIMVGLGASAILVAAVVTTAVLSQSKASPHRGPVAQLGPFQGAASEGFDALGVEVTQQGISILGKTATVSNLTHGGALKVAAGSSMGGVLVTAHSQSFMLGQIGISEWVFSTPLTKFGAYFANNSRFDDAKVDLYDVNDILIGSAKARVPKSLRGWTWNGWQSDVPIHRLVVTGNDAGFMHGFIWFDDVQVVTAPQPACTITCSTNIAVCNDPSQGGAVVRFPIPVATNGTALGIQCVPPSGSFFPVGTNFVLCTATNEAGHVANTCSFEITVHDCEPPVIHSIAASPEVLWPPNRRMEQVTVRVEASDNCHLARCKIISVGCSESMPGHGTVHTTAGWEITGELTVNLRAERSSAGTGRVYSITVECRDDSGNASTAVVHVTVPSDQGQRTVPLRSPPDKVQYARRTDDCQILVQLPHDNL